MLPTPPKIYVDSKQRISGFKMLPKRIEYKVLSSETKSNQKVLLCIVSFVAKRTMPNANVADIVSSP